VILSTKECKDLIVRPFASAHLQRAKYQESRLRFHGQIAENRRFASGYLVEYLQWVKSIITAKDKYAQFENMLQFPLKSNTVIDTIADEYAKVFNSQNGYIGYDFTDSELRNQYTDFEKGYEHFWRKDVFTAMMTAINSIVVVDMKQTEDMDVKPYYYLLSIDRVLDVRCNHEGKIEYLIFKDGVVGDRWERIVVMDDTSYRVYHKDGEKIMPVSSFAHPLGYTPASFMWNDSIEPNNPYIKQGPTSAIQGDLDWYQFQTTSKKCLDIYASFPIYWYFDSKCEVGGCNGGFVKYMTEGVAEPMYKRCPSCEKNSVVGAGTVFKTPAPRDNTAPNLREPAGIIPAERQSLDYNVDETERLREEIIKAATGKMNEKNRTTGAMNEDQVHSNYESQTNILAWIAGNFEKIHSWVINTTATLMYGERYLGCTVSYGTEFYLKDQDDVTQEYEAAKTAGLPLYMLQAKRYQVDELQSKNNPSEKERILILRQLEPYQDLTMTDVFASQSILDPDLFAIKLNFTTFVNRFELEHGNIVEWGALLDLNTKVSRINEVFKTYVGELKVTKPPESGTEAA
jgi:hypothetical protein